MIYVRCRVDTIDSPDDEHMVARNMWSIEINTYGKELCVMLVIYKSSPEYIMNVFLLSVFVSQKFYKNF